MSFRRGAVCFESRHEWRTEFPATLEAIEQFCLQFQIWREAACAQLDQFQASLLLREALTNAVVHGSAEDPHQRIFCVLRAGPDRLFIAISDEGAGFDWRAVWSRTVVPADTHGRGLEIFRRYASRVRFNRRGNAVMLIIRFVTGERI